MPEPNPGNPAPTADVDLLIEEALALHQRGEVDPARALYERVLALAPRNVTAIHALGVISNQCGNPEEAVRLLRQALQLNPRSAMAHFHLGQALWNQGLPGEALIHYQYSIVFKADHADAHRNRGMALAVLGRPEEALASFERALALKPEDADAHSNKIFILDYLPRFGFAEVQAERRAYYEAHAKALAEPEVHRNDRDPDRPLVLGYVSADFCRHSAATCFGPVLRRHDRDAFQVVCYSGVQQEDDWTRAFKEAADLWRPTAGLSDPELAARIRADRVDILVDLSGHSKGNRLLTFARRPAPVQVTAWGHGGGTGLPMVDCQFTDPVHIPAWARSLYPEPCVDLPCCITFEAPAQAPPVADLPARAKGFVTFGSLNRFAKVTPALLDLWARILEAVPGSRLLLKDGLLDDPQARTRVLAPFLERGLDPARLELRGFTSHLEHLAAYGEVDLVLDTFPQNGGITTWEALWMGPPVLTVLGNKPPARISGAILEALGHGDWVAADEEAYVAEAVARAADLDGLARFRAGIRERIAASPAGNPELYTRAVERAYRALWRTWLAR